MDIHNTNNWIIIGVIAVVLILGGWWVATRQHSPVVGKSADTATTSEKLADATQKGAMVTTASAGETISAVANQEAGMSVTIASMHLSKASWVAIKDKNGWILGAGWFPASATSATVPLLRGTKPGETYTALIYVDDGDKTFDFHVDSLVDGVSSTFTTNASSSAK